MTNRSNSEAPPWTILKLLRWTTAYFKSHDIENPRASAEILLSHMLGAERIDLYVRYDQPLMEEELARFKVLVKRRAQGEPAAYIVGEKEFWSMALAVTPEVLIPRPETECLVEAALALMRKGTDTEPRRILELGTGSGAIALALHSERPGDDIVASDRSLKALQVARRNAVRHHAAEAVAFFCGDWFDAVGPGASPFDMILSNPPYIRAGDLTGLQPEVRDFEPRTALDGGPDGLSAVRHLIRHAPLHLGEGGYLLLEIGHDQRSEIETIVQDSGAYADLAFEQDYSGLDRVVRMRKRSIGQPAGESSVASPAEK